MHVWMGYVMERAYGHGMGLLTGTTLWYFFDGAVNSWVLNKEWWYIGTTAWIDITQRKLASWLREDPRLISAILKHALLILSILNLFVS